LTSPSGSEVVVIAKLPGVGPLSPPQAVNPRTEILEKMTAQKTLPITLPRFIEIVSCYPQSRIQIRTNHCKRTTAGGLYHEGSGTNMMSVTTPLKADPQAEQKHE
jgi:hypothetical protein